nr:MAG TPA: hypothetical protein [Caudoviricetes sp.]
MKRIIWTFEYGDFTKFRANIMMLINLINYYTFMIYGDYSCLVDLNAYYTEMSIDEMYKRLTLEFHRMGF